MGCVALLSENIRWVGQITLEGERLTADDIVLNRDAVIGARLDKPGVRTSFVLVALLLIAALVLSVTLFLQSLQFFDPDYTRFALSLAPLIGLGWASYQLRPRYHLSVMVCDGSALLLASRDGNFLSMCLEAFERLWADKSRMRASLYLHAGHRSVDFGPSGAVAVGTAGVAGGSTVNDPLPPMPELPMFDEDELATEMQGAEAQGVMVEGAMVEGADAPELDELSVEEAMPPLPPPPPVEVEVEVAAVAEADPAPELISPPPPPPPPLPIPPKPAVEMLVEKAAEPELSIADLLGANEQPNEDVRVEPVLIEEAVEARPDDDLDRMDELTAGEDMFALAIEPESEPEPEIVEEEPEPLEPEVPAGPVIVAEIFDGVRPKVGTLSRLLRDRPDFAELIDAVDVLDKHIVTGCQTLGEAEALASAITAMRGPLAVYPAALQVVEAVAQAAELDRFAQEDTSHA